MEHVEKYLFKENNNKINLSKLYYKLKKVRKLYKHKDKYEEDKIKLLKKYPSTDDEFIIYMIKQDTISPYIGYSRRSLNFVIGVEILDYLFGKKSFMDRFYLNRPGEAHLLKTLKTKDLEFVKKVRDKYIHKMSKNDHVINDCLQTYQIINMKLNVKLRNSKQKDNFPKKMAYIYVFKINNDDLFIFGYQTKINSDKYKEIISKSLNNRLRKMEIDKVKLVEIKKISYYFTFQIMLNVDFMIEKHKEYRLNKFRIIDFRNCHFKHKSEIEKQLILMANMDIINKLKDDKPRRNRAKELLLKITAPDKTMRYEIANKSVKQFFVENKERFYAETFNDFRLFYAKDFLFNYKIKIIDKAFDNKKNLKKIRDKLERIEKIK